MIRLYCDYCTDELKGMGGAELRYVKIVSSIEKQPQAKEFNEHICDKCLEKLQTALKVEPDKPTASPETSKKGS